MKTPLDKTIIQNCCANHCRDWRETHGGMYPASNHSPMCENFKLETFLRVSQSLGRFPFCIVETQAEVDEMEQAGDEKLVVESVELTRDQFEHLDEFDGF